MTILSDLRDRLPGHSAPASPELNDDGSVAPGQGEPPIKGYDRLDARQVIGRLAHHTQAELCAIEDYERAHENRIEVLQKLRYMRGAEPMEGYDDLTPAEITTALETANIVTIKKIRAYEQKFANRRDVIDAVASAHSAHHAAKPPEPVPAYMAGGGKRES